MVGLPDVFRPSGEFSFCDSNVVKGWLGIGIVSEVNIIGMEIILFCCVRCRRRVLKKRVNTCQYNFILNKSGPVLISVRTLVTVHTPLNYYARINCWHWPLHEMSITAPSSWFISIYSGESLLPRIASPEQWFLGHFGNSCQDENINARSNGNSGEILYAFRSAVTQELLTVRDDLD
jgi:hypothetical protein